METTNDKPILLLVAPLSSSTVAKTFGEWKDSQDEYQLFHLISKKGAKKYIEKNAEYFDNILTCTFSDPDSIRKTLAPYKDKIIAASCRSEAKMWYYEKTIPQLPYLNAPTESSLDWCVDKIQMRKRLASFNSEITPKFKVVDKYSKEMVDAIESHVAYPCVVKPSGLAQSLLVTICYHREELEESLKKVLKKTNILNRFYKESFDQSRPTVLVEEYMEGDQYSIDGVVDSVGKVSLYPPVYVKTGDKIGFDDFFGYMQMTPTKLKDASIASMHDVAIQSVHALGLRSCSVHIELLRTEDGWKIIELGPRVGGFRQDLYDLSFGINCTSNDFNIRLDLHPDLNRKVKGHTAFLKIFAKKEGKISSINGFKKVEALESLVRIKQAKQKGDRAKFAKNGGKAVFTMVMHNADRSKLLADVRRMEKELVINIE